MNSRRRGLSLLEIVISMGLFIITITVTVFVMQAVLDASRRSEQLEQVQERMLVTFEDLASSCRQANVWISPAPNVSTAVTELELETPDQRRDDERWPLPVPDPPDTPSPAWNPRSPARQCRMRFYVAAEGLKRRLGTAEQNWSPDVEELTAQREAPCWIHLTLKYRTSRGSKEIRGRVLLPLQRGWSP